MFADDHGKAIVPPTDARDEGQIHTHLLYKYRQSDDYSHRDRV